MNISSSIGSSSISNNTQLRIFDTEQINDDVEKVLKIKGELHQMNLEYQRKLTMITNISSTISNKNFGLRGVYQVEQNNDEVLKIYYEIYKDLKNFFSLYGKKNLSGSKTSSSTMVEKDLDASKTSSSTMVEKDLSGSSITGKRKQDRLLIDSCLVNPKKQRNSKINGMKLIPQDCPAPHLIENWWSSFNELKKIYVKKNTLLDCSQIKNASYQYQWLRNQIQNLEDEKGTVFQDDEIRKEFQSFVGKHQIREKYCSYLPDGKMKILFKRPLGSKSRYRELSDSDSDISDCEIDDDAEIDNDSDIDNDLLQSLLEFIKKNYRVNVNSAIDRTSFYNNYIANLENGDLKTMITDIGKGRGGHKKPIGFIFDNVCKLQERGKIDHIITISNCGDYFQHYNLDRK